MPDSDVFCGRCGAPLADPHAPCWRCGAPTGFLPQRQPKSPWLAVSLALVPGLGHLYLGQPLKALGYFAGTIGLGFFGFDFDLSVIGAAIGVPLELGGGTLWLYSIIDAWRSAHRLQAPVLPRPHPDSSSPAA